MDAYVRFKEFDKLIFQEFSVSNFLTNKEADDFFIKYGVGNSYFEMSSPFERFLFYEYLLRDLITYDYAKYQRMHKGTPFYFLAWLAVDLRYYEKALFFIDSSISEDSKNAVSDIFSLPSFKFLLLDYKGQVAERTIRMVNTYLTAQINRFNALGKEQITVEAFISKFVKPLLLEERTRTIISALYVFILEFSERQQEIKMRSTKGGSLAPFINHLFTGALIFETLLKVNFPRKDNGNPTRILREIFEIPSYQKVYPQITDGSADSFQKILATAVDSTIKTAFTTTTKIRNTTGHNLVWDDVFSNPNNYQNLFFQEVNAIFYIISNSYLKVQNS